MATNNYRYYLDGIKLDGIGLAALIPGMVVAQRILENSGAILAKHIEQMQADIAAINGRHARKKTGRPRNAEKTGELTAYQKAAKKRGNGWQNRTAKQKRDWLKAINEGRKRAQAKRQREARASAREAVAA